MFEKQFEDAVLVAAYMKHKSQTKAAEEVGCSRETVARAVRRAGIPLTGRKNNGDHKGNYGGGSPRKITDEELIEESKTMTRVEIAKKHSMNLCNVDRKLSRLGIHCVKAKRGELRRIGTGRHYHERAVAYGRKYDPDVTLKKVISRYDGICQICGKPIDAKDFSGKGVGRLYPTIDHIIPLSKGGSHTWDNVQLAHLVCNSHKSDLITV